MPVLAFSKDYIARANAVQALKTYAVKMAGPQASQRFIDEIHEVGVAGFNAAIDGPIIMDPSMTDEPSYERAVDVYMFALADQDAMEAAKDERKAAYSASGWYTDVDESDGALLLPPSPPARTNDEIIADVALAIEVPTEEAVLAQYAERDGIDY
jgi:hypothetical protein